MWIEESGAEKRLLDEKAYQADEWRELTGKCCRQITGNVRV
jgi:hypothetical protein